MSDSADNALAELSSWEAESFRLTIFPAPKPYSIESSWWEQLVGEPPEERVNQPREGIIREQGPAFDGLLSLVIQTTRIDWVLASTQPPLSLGELPTFTSTFVSHLREWLLERCPPAQRIAFGLAARLPVADKSAGYQTLSKYLRGISIDPENSSDFLYQINRPRASKVDIQGLKMNRLSRWSVGFMQHATFSMSDGKTSASVQQSQFHCRAELDINTGVDFVGEFTQSQSYSIVEELAELGLEIITNGDIP